MPDRPVTVSLSATGVNPVSVAGIVTDFSRPQRVLRSAVVMGIAVLLAATLIPIPIIHLLGIPLLLLTGVVASVRQMTKIGRLHPVKVACPKCGATNRVGGGLGYTSLEPQERMCDSCRRGLTLTIVPRD